MRFTSQLLVIWIISTTMQHVRSQKETSNEAGETKAGKTKWTAKMNANLVDSRKEANALYSTQDAQGKKVDGR